MLRLTWLLAFLITGGFAATASAGSFEVAPTTITLPATASSTVIHITNRGSTAVYAQVEALDWAQENMRDSFTPSETLLVSPPMVHLVPGQQQTIRVVMNADNNDKQEHAHRLMVSELPDPASKKEGIQVLLQFLVPVFVSTAQTSAPKLLWKATQESDHILITATNGGAAHLKLSALSVTDNAGAEIAVSGQAFTYLLSGAQHQWKLKADPAHSQTLTIRAQDEATGIIKGSYVVGK